MKRSTNIILIGGPIILLPFITYVVPLFGIREEFFHFSKHDSLYFNAYDTLKSSVFITNKGIDTLIINKKEIREEYGKYYFSGTEGSVFNAFCYCEGKLIHEDVQEDFKLFFRKIYHDLDPEISLSIGDSYAMPIYDSRNFKSPGIYKDTIIIDGHNIKYRHPLSHNYKIEYLKLHKYKGIVEYKLSDGTIYKDSI